MGLNNTWMSAPTILTSAEAFRKAWQGLHDSLLICGWAVSDDTGQADLAAVEAPTGTSNTPAGYRIYYLNDSLHDAYPIYLKVEYGRGGSINGNSPTWWFTVGRGSNGSGEIEGVLLPRKQSATVSAASGTATEYPSYASGDGHGVCVGFWAGFSGAASTFFALERSRDVDGLATGEGVLIAASPGVWSVIGYRGVPDEAMHAQSTHASATFPHAVNGLAQAQVVNGTLSRDGVVAPVLPLPCMAPGVTPWVSNIMVGVHPGDAATTSIIQAATINGEERTYRAFPFVTASGLVVCSSAPSYYVWPAILWED